LEVVSVPDAILWPGDPGWTAGYRTGKSCFAGKEQTIARRRCHRRNGIGKASGTAICAKATQDQTKTIADFNKVLKKKKSQIFPATGISGYRMNSIEIRSLERSPT